MKKINLQQLAQEINEVSINEIETKEIHDIAIIGISVKLPYAEDINQFWENLKTGRDCIRDLPTERKAESDRYLNYVRKTNAEMKYKKGSYLERVDEFDCRYFNISPREASLMDPNQRMFLEIALNAVEDAGYGGDKLKGSRTGVYFGFVSDLGYQRFIANVEPSALGMSIPGNMAAIIPGRVSYVLDLKGPSMLIDTACSSSLVAIHTACRAIQKGDCDLAIVGGSKISLLPVEDDNMLGIESKNYICRAFDEDADGTCMGEGVMALLLKPLSRAIKDYDHIYAVIKGTAVNQDGTSMGITAPNARAQAEVIEAAWQDAGIDPKTITYIEAHGTGTKLGDPIEIDGISKAFSKYTTKKQFCAVGSVKTNLGHLDSAAGMVGLIKAVLALQHKQIPPSLHFDKPNPCIDFENSPVYVNSELIDWEPAGFPRRCGVSAFGLSGTNSHVILEEAPSFIFNEESVGYSQILALSAKKPDLLRRLLSNYLSFFETGSIDRLSDLCYTVNTGREHYNCRLAIITNGLDDLKAKLSELKEEGFNTNEAKGIYYGEPISFNSMDRDNEIGIAPKDELKEVDLILSQIENIHDNESEAHLLQELCNLYIAGLGIDWRKLYEKGNYHKISLPKYPFEKRRCWLDLPSIKNLSTQIEASKLSEKGKRLSSVTESNINNKTAKIVSKVRNDEDYSDLEMQIAQVWEEVLGFEEININDNFFDLGGNSINIIKLNELLNKKIGRQVETVILFQFPTIHSLAQYLARKEATEEDNEKVEAKMDDSIQLMENSLKIFEEVN